MKDSKGFGVNFLIKPYYKGRSQQIVLYKVKDQKFLFSLEGFFFLAKVQEGIL